MNVQTIKKSACCLLFATAALQAFPQGASLSPYSQFGLGDLAPQGMSANRGVDGLGIALHRGNAINSVNPASYAYVDSLTFLFDVGASGQITNFKEGSLKKTAKTASFDYAAAAYRLSKNFGMSFGLQPYTNIDYEYSVEEAVVNNDPIYSVFEGEGGLSKLYVGLGYRPLKHLAIGVSGAYLWGEMRKGVVTGANSSLDLNILSKIYDVDFRNFALDFGAQYDIPIGKDRLTLGVTYGLGHNLNADADLTVMSVNSSVSKADTTRYVISKAYELPHTFGAGITYSKGEQWFIGADVQMQQWGKTKYPEHDVDGYKLRDNLLDDMYKATLGFELCPRWNSRRFFDRIRYSAGVSYATPYYKVNGKKGPKQLSASVGFAIPIMNAYNNRSVLHISGQWSNRSADGMLKENTFRINIGMTFNEKWFAKWKIE